MDATMYEDNLDQNTGLDEIIEVRHYEKDGLFYFLGYQDYYLL